jgi:hypothetical protein
LFFALPCWVLGLLCLSLAGCFALLAGFRLLGSLVLGFVCFSMGVNRLTVSLCLKNHAFKPFIGLLRHFSGLQPPMVHR